MPFLGVIQGSTITPLGAAVNAGAFELVQSGLGANAINSSPFSYAITSNTMDDPLNQQRIYGTGSNVSILPFAGVAAIDTQATALVSSLPAGAAKNDIITAQAVTGFPHD
jgi:hypothetical protein